MVWTTVRVCCEQLHVSLQQLQWGDAEGLQWGGQTMEVQQCAVQPLFSPLPFCTCTLCSCFDCPHNEWFPILNTTERDLQISSLSVGPEGQRWFSDLTYLPVSWKELIWSLSNANTCSQRNRIPGELKMGFFLFCCYFVVCFLEEILDVSDIETILWDLHKVTV